MAEIERPGNPRLIAISNLYGVLLSLVVGIGLVGTALHNRIALTGAIGLLLVAPSLVLLSIALRRSVSRAAVSFALGTVLLVLLGVVLAL